MRRKKLNLRGSVTQNAPVRLRARETTRFGLLLRFSALAGSLVIMVGIAMWLWHIGWPQKQVEHLVTAGLHATQKAHFEVEDIQVEGRQQTSKEALAAALGIASGAPILAFDPTAAQARIAKLPWVASATVERRLPDTIIVRLSERTPMARWQHEGHTVIIDADGKELPGAQADQFAQLPLVVGLGAPHEAKELLDVLKDFPAIMQRMTAATRVSERRWDIYLQSKVVARLPENNVPAALKRLSQLITEQNVLDLDVASIDLRVPGRLVIEPANTTAASKPAEGKHL